MSTTDDDTEIFPADERGGLPPRNGRAGHGSLTAPAPRRERERPAARPAPAIPARFVTALLRALAVWPT